MPQGSLCPAEDDWQKYILNADSVDRQKLGNHLKECSYCRFLAAQLGHELEGLRSVWDQGSQTDVMPLSVLRFEDMSEGDVTPLLAAKGDEETEETTSVTLSSPDQEILLRAVRDPHSGEMWLYLMADDPDLCRNVLVRPFASEEDLLTDDQGRINLGTIDWPKGEDLTAEVHLPKAVFQLSPSRDLPEPMSTTTLESPSGDKISVSLEGEGRNRKLVIQVLQISELRGDGPLKVAIRGEGTSGLSQIQPVVLEKTSFDGVGDHEVLEIYLYQ